MGNSPSQPNPKAKRNKHSFLCEDCSSEYQTGYLGQTFIHGKCTSCSAKFAKAQAKKDIENAKAQVKRDREAAKAKSKLDLQAKKPTEAKGKGKSELTGRNGHEKGGLLSPSTSESGSTSVFCAVDKDSPGETRVVEQKDYI